MSESTRYAGHSLEPNTGFTYMNARYYEPVTARFLTPDTYTGNPYNPNTQNVYSYTGNNPVNYVDPTGHERIVVSGGAYDTDQDDYQFHFIDPALKQIRDWRIWTKENITWIISMAGWEESDIGMFREAVKDLNVNVVTVNNAGELIDYMNNGSSNNRSDDLITHFAAFSHGLPGEIALGYHHSNSSDLSFTTDMISSLNSGAFSHKMRSIFYPCNTGAGGADSFAQAWANVTGGKTKALVGRSDYAGINSLSWYNWHMWAGYKVAREINGGYSVPQPSFRYPIRGYQSNGQRAYWKTYKPN